MQLLSIISSKVYSNEYFTGTKYWTVLAYFIPGRRERERERRKREGLTEAILPMFTSSSVSASPMHSNWNSCSDWENFWTATERSVGKKTQNKSLDIRTKQR